MASTWASARSTSSPEPTTERRTMLNAIGPVWDGNEVWLVTGGGALFAAFPMVYATVFSGFYLAFMLLLAALIFRAVSIEFRSKQPMRWWRQMWDVGFFIGQLSCPACSSAWPSATLPGACRLDAEHEYRRLLEPACIPTPCSWASRPWPCS